MAYRPSVSRGLIPLASVARAFSHFSIISRMARGYAGDAVKASALEMVRAILSAMRLSMMRFASRMSALSLSVMICPRADLENILPLFSPAFEKSRLAFVV